MDKLVTNAYQNIIKYKYTSKVFRDVKYWALNIMQKLLLLLLFLILYYFFFHFYISVRDTDYYDNICVYCFGNTSV